MIRLGRRLTSSKQTWNRYSKTASTHGSLSTFISRPLFATTTDTIINTANAGRPIATTLYRCQHTNTDTPPPPPSPSKMKQWEALVEKELKRSPSKLKTAAELRTNRLTPEGIEVQPIYYDWRASDEKIELSGLPPYTRGPYATMFVGKPWTIRQVCL